MIRSVYNDAVSVQSNEVCLRKLLKTRHNLDNDATMANYVSPATAATLINNKNYNYNNYYNDTSMRGQLYILV